ncbi:MULTISPECIES: Holliday junction branch migration protein RuvA [unclassified Marinobacter]|uniref:Holliday junction branch migration protein RuvA n=1 Tax=unclassified Marinobacter TaxID=83889 RepID=UPI0026E1D418|nr:MULTISPECIES: Holliday junction branch migration protein RuvA [unclassified Marinobacter]MDO6440526.1 Holliday junction branch migration protein RuvA [Marinobacter sp. 2_MG-2023]MDO6823354.1 Holliday junction branch migration protein RuvA [Marinobacter sp. 1_MG-2023]
MIGRIRGILVEKTPGQALVECGGLGYEVDIPYTTFFHLPEPGQEITLHTHFAVREDAQSLFGFAARLDRDLFRLLIKVNGVGPKLAAGILSGLDAQQFIRCVEGRDINSLVKLPGVGKKTAERLLIEMTDRIKQLEGHFVPESAGTTGSITDSPQLSVATHNPADEAEAALIALGYKPQEAARAITKVAEEGMSSEALIRLALRNMIPA